MISLGQASNYSARAVFRQLFAIGTTRDSLNLRKALANRYGLYKDLSSRLIVDLPVENVALYHSGRSALAACIKILKNPSFSDDFPVILPGLTCIAVVRAIRAAGATPVFCDIEAERLEYNYHNLEQIMKGLGDFSGEGSGDFPGEGSGDFSQKNRQKSHKSIKQSIDKSKHVCYNGIVIVQNTLGLSSDVQKIEELAKKYNFAILEDLAHCAGRYYADGREIGTVGQAAALSFGKGKAIDTICGGAAVIRRESICKELLQPAKKPRASARWRDRWYPLLATLCRASWRCGLGRLSMAAFIKLRWVERSADTPLCLSVRLTHWQARLALRQLAQLPTGALREFTLVENRAALLDELYQNGYNFSEIWYDTPVSPARYAAEAKFPAKSCPETVKISAKIINLPTWYPPEKLALACKIIADYQGEKNEKNDLDSREKVPKKETKDFSERSEDPQELAKKGAQHG